MRQGGSSGIATSVTAWLDDLGGHAEAADAIATLGEAAIPALAAYLAGEPQVVPQPRCFAVAMLARLHADAATQVLRAALHAHPLRSLDSRYAESEYVVKSDALEALRTRTYPELADDIAWAIHERLRIAVTAAGAHRLINLADALIDMLDDDVLAEAAVESLVRFGPASATAIAPRLDAWLVEAEGAPRRLLALLRALRVLHRVHARLDAAVARHAAMAEHPALRAAATLLAWPAQHDDATIDALLHGAIGCDLALADECRDALANAGPALARPARQALQRNAEPDLYGDWRALSTAQRDWLGRCLHA